MRVVEARCVLEAGWFWWIRGLGRLGSGRMRLWRRGRRRLCSGGLRGIWFRGGGFGFCVFGFWFRQVGWNQAERYLVDVMQNICIWMVGMLSSILHYIYHVLANELGDEAFSTD